ncbi:type VII secretion protein EccB [Streptacidiphilus rugosus]|uniref:type VII secretion protein EccB n=1 Tax=Streptacidiphilus rugosus TaxID=405783 RepID=UPI00056542DD|nr:type VII secretion protein EccB [Streptacidiphilus rugosus]
MASRRNELSAYTFARKRTVAAFLQPSGGGNVEDAPRALRAVVPSLVLGAVAVAAFGAYGMLRPSAPHGWQTANAVIVDKQTTTRYVMLDGVLHPVLNMSSARLLLSGNSGVQYIDDSVLNSPQVQHGPTIGIPYAPDSLPTAADAGVAKTWAACERSDATATDGVAQKLFVLGGAQAALVHSHGRLTSGQALYVQTADGVGYLVDASGVSHELVASAKDARKLAVAAFGASAGRPQQVTSAWLKTLVPGDPISLPRADIQEFGKPYHGPDVGAGDRRVGDLLKVTDTSGGVLHYVLLQDGPHKISDFALGLVGAMHLSTAEIPVSQYKLLNSNLVTPFESGKDWPQAAVSQANLDVSAGAMASCAVYDGVMNQNGPKLGVWLGADFPVNQNSGTAGVYVTPGTGLLLQAVNGGAGGGGKVYLLTDTGLRYPVQMNSDGNGAPASGGSNGSADAAGAAGSAGAAGANGQSDTAAARLGYGRTGPNPVPLGWADLVPSGPALTKDAAEQQQGS